MTDLCFTGLLNCTDTIGSLIVAGATNLSGDMFLMLMAILLILIAMAIGFGIPLELVGIAIIPICLILGTQYNQFLAPLIVIIIYFAGLLATKWIFK